MQFQWFKEKGKYHFADYLFSTLNINMIAVEKLHHKFVKCSLIIHSDPYKRLC